VVVPVSDDVAPGARMTVPVIGFLIAHPAAMFSSTPACITMP
jgi:hypothetical protein